MKQRVDAAIGPAGVVGVGELRKDDRDTRETQSGVRLDGRSVGQLHLGINNQMWTRLGVGEAHSSDETG